MNSGFGRKLVIRVVFFAAAAFGQQFSGRVGASNDGNQHAPDDIGAAGWIVGIFAKAGARYVHHDYANHLGDNDPDMEARMHSSTIGAARRYYYDTSMCFNDQTNLDGAIANIANQINASSAADSFYMVCCGPMEVPWRGIAASDSGKRQYCVFLSHSGWNDDHTGAPLMTHKWSDIEASGVNCIHISNQNANLQVNDMGRWAWAKNSEDPDIKFLADIMAGGDISDAGGAYFLVSGMGDQNGTPEKLNALFDQTTGLFFRGVSGSAMEYPTSAHVAVGGKVLMARTSAVHGMPVRVYDVRGSLAARYMARSGVDDMANQGTAGTGIDSTGSATRLPLPPD